jgi:hypothetical protein
MQKPQTDTAKLLKILITVLTLITFFLLIAGREMQKTDIDQIAGREMQKTDIDHFYFSLIAGREMKKTQTEHSCDGYVRYIKIN